ncbi:MAG: PepSY domain-containing protein [Frankiaceae bacterium]
MNSTTSRHFLVAGLALAVSAGTGAAVAHAGGPHNAPRLSSGVPTTTTTTNSATAAVVTSAGAGQVAATTAGSLTAAQARTAAERIGHGRATEVDAETDTTGNTYDVKLIRPDGVEVKVVLDARTGRAVRIDAGTETSDEANNQEKPAAQDTADGQDKPETQDAPS